jgi:phospholipase A-2-activating protein
MSSLSLLLPNYTLSQSLQVHSDAVRCISISEDLLLTGSYDSTLFLGRHIDNKYELVTTYSHHTTPVYSCVLSPDKISFFSGDKSGAIYHSNLDGTSKKIIGTHEKTVCSLDTFENYVISGSWDATGRIWDVNTGINTITLPQDKHSHGVIVKSFPFGILTGSQNGVLNFWTHSGLFVRGIKVHDDMIKKICYSEEIGIITCSNDNTVKVVTIDGRIINTLIGHSGYVLACEYIGLDIISGGDDKTLKVWRNSECVDSILHPNTIWDVGVNYLGDIVTASADFYTRVFTIDKSRVAEDAEIALFHKSSTHVESSSDLDLTKYPNISELPFRHGNKEGDIQVFTNGAVGEAYMWHVEGSYWEKIGEVVGSGPKASASKHYEGDRIFPSGEYDYIFDVELGDNVIRKLPYNNDQNPLESAEKFIAREGMRRDYIQEITKFISANAKPTYNKPTPKPQQVSSKYFPQVICAEFSTGNLEPIVAKIKEFNSLLEPPHKLDELELRNLDRLSGVLSNRKTYNTSSLTVKDLDLILKLLHWPKPNLFPCLDLYRIALLHNSAQEVFKTSDHGAEHIGYISALVSTSKDNPTLITGLRVLSNMFFGNSSQYSIETRRDLVLDAVLVHIENNNKNVRAGLITLLYNYSVKLAAKDEMEGKIQILAALNEIFQNESDPDNLFRAFVTVGNILTGGGTRKELVETAKQLGIVEIIKAVKCSDKANECRNDLANLLR